MFRINTSTIMTYQLSINKFRFADSISIKMIQGVFNPLTSSRKTQHGHYLSDNEGNEALLPNKYVPDGFDVGDEISAFIFKDSEDRLTATTIEPTIKLNEFAVLEVLDMNKIGAFMDWGMEKDLLVPYSEQRQRMQTNRSYPVYMYLDSKTDRLVGTCKVDRYLKLDELTVEKDQEVDLLICNPTEIGINVIINDIHKGLLYDNELFQAVSPGERIRGYIKNIRPDNKIDVSIQKQGYESIEPNAERILQKLKDNGGHLNITDKTDPVIILARLEMSKKVFKKSIGLLYKKKLIKLGEDGISLLV